jgi:GTPase SAR1 family protein
LKQRAQPIIDNRKKHIALNYKLYPRRPYGIPTKYPEKTKSKFKIVVVGDGSVGKTTLLYTHVQYV